MLSDGTWASKGSEVIGFASISSYVFPIAENVARESFLIIFLALPGVPLSRKPNEVLHFVLFDEVSAKASFGETFDVPGVEQ